MVSHMQLGFTVLNQGQLDAKDKLLNQLTKVPRQQAKSSFCLDPCNYCSLIQNSWELQALLQAKLIYNFLSTVSVDTE